MEDALCNDTLSLILKEMPLGVVLVNAALEVIYVNQNVSDFLVDMPGEIGLKLGEYLRCENATAPDTPCGTRPKCNNCVIRNNAINAMHQMRTIRNVKIHFRHMLKAHLCNSWLDLTFVPQEVDGEVRLWLFFINTTERVKEKLAREMHTLLSES